MKIIAEQIILGLDDIYGRTIKLLDYGKDSSSLCVNKIRYGEIEGHTVIILRSWKIKEDLNELFNFLKLTEEEKCKFC